MSTIISPSPTLDPDMQNPATVWRVSLSALLLVLASVLTLYRTTGAEMFTIWIRSATFTHAILVPPIVLWLLWRQRDRLAAITPRANAWVLLPAMGVALLWLLGELAAVHALTQIAFVAMLVLAVPAVLGTRMAREAAFPLAFLFFAVPLGEFLLPVLMQLTADFTVAALRLSGVPVFREGLLFVIPSGKWSIIEACSGVRYLIASFMVGTLYAYLMYRSTRRRLTFMAVALLVPLLANWVRAYLIVMLANLSDNRIATGVDHLIYGWAFFGFVICLLFVIGMRWAESRTPSPAQGAPALPMPERPIRASSWATPAVAVTMILVAAAPLAMQREIVKRESTTAPTLAMPDMLGPGWHANVRTAAAWRPKLDNPSAEVDTVYAHDDQAAVGLYVAYYRNQDYLRKLGDSNSLLARSEDNRWSRVAESHRRIVVGSRSVDVATAELRDRDELSSGVGLGITAWQLYWIGGSFTSSDTIAKAHVAINRLLGRGDDSAEIIVYTSNASSEVADQTLEAFLRANLDALDAQLNQVRSRR